MLISFAPKNLKTAVAIAFPGLGAEGDRYNYYLATTKLTSLLGTTMTFFTSFPSIYF